MSSIQKGFVVPLSLIFVTVLILVGGVYYYSKNKEIVTPDTLNVQSNSFSQKIVEPMSVEVTSTGAPHIDLLAHDVVPIGSTLVINGSDFNWSPPENCQTIGCFAHEHRFVMIKNSSGKSAILMEDDGLKNSTRLPVVVNSSLCTHSQGEGLPCEPIDITPGKYSLWLEVGGRDLSNVVPLTIVTAIGATRKAYLSPQSTSTMQSVGNTGESGHHLGGCYWQEKENTYCSIWEGDGSNVITILPNADFKTFEILGVPKPNTFGRNYAKDKNQVYYFGGILIGANPKTFSVLEDLYSKDDTHVYFEGGILPRADADTFQFLGMHYSKDKNAVYKYGSIVPNQDPATFVAPM